MIEGGVYMRPIDYNGDLSNGMLEDEIFNILDALATRIAIENRRQQSVLERLQEEYRKTRAEEFLGGIKTTETVMAAIDRQVQDITKLTITIDNLSKANESNFNERANAINVAYANLCFYSEVVN